RQSINDSLMLTHLPEAIKAECRTSGNYPKSLLLTVVRAPNLEAQLALWQQIKAGTVTVRHARRVTNQARQPGPKPYPFTYLHKKPTLSVQVLFRKARASYDDIKDALREALKSIS